MQTNSFRMFRVALALLASALLGACGGGGGGGSTSGDGSDSTSSSRVSTSPETLEYFQGSLSYVAPFAPATVVELDAGAAVADNTNSGPAPVLGGSWDAGERVVANERVARVVYERDGSLYRVGTDPDITPTPTRVSSESSADIVCNFRIGQDFADPENARIVYEVDTSSSDDCSTSTWRVTRLGAGAGTDPGSFPGEPIVGLIDPSDGSHAGWLALDGGNVTLREPGGTTATVAGDPGTTANASYLESLLDGTVLLNLDGELWRYAQGAGLASLGHTFGGTGTAQAYVADGDELYFLDQNTLYRTNVAADAVTQLFDPSDDTLIVPAGSTRLTVTETFVVYTYPRDTNTDGTVDDIAIYQIDKSGSGGGALAFVNRLDLTATVANQGIFDRSGEWFFYTRVDSTGAPEAVALKADGSAEEVYPGARWVGASINLGSFQELGGSLEILYLVEGLSSTASSYGGATLKSVEVANPGTALDLGTLRTDVQSLTLGGGYGDERLAFVQADDGVGGTTADVYFVNGSESGSLTAIASDKDTDENPVVFF